MSSQYIYVMHRLSKEYPPDKTVLKDVNLQFFPGAKIGVLGYNGAGKSTTMKMLTAQVIADARARGHVEVEARDGGDLAEALDDAAHGDGELGHGREASHVNPTAPEYETHRGQHPA